MNLFPPNVVARATSVQIGDTVAFRNMFTASDLDGNEITTFRFRDNSAAATSGFFTVRGVRQDSNVFVEVGLEDLDFVRYNAGLIESSETFSVQVGDGGSQFSTIDVSQVNTILANFFPPEIDVTPGSVQEREVLDPRTLFSVSDPEGNPAVRFFFVDRRTNDNGGHFLFRGVRQESGRFFSVEADELDQVVYIGGRFGQTENIGIQAFDGEFTSEVVDVAVTTLPNQFAPDVNAFNVNSATGRVIAAESLFSFSDQDGNTPKVVGFIDTGLSPNSGFFTVNDVRQDAGSFFQVQANQLSSVEYHVSDVASSEVYRVFVSDGRFSSGVQTATVNAIPRPSLVAPDRTFEVDELQRIDIVDVVDQFDNGPALTTFQVLDQDTSPVSGRLLLNGERLEQGVVHTLTAQQFANLQIEGRPADGRGRDQYLVRGRNELFYTDWESFDVNSEPVGARSLTSGFNYSDQIDNGEKFVITYSFIDGVDSVGDGTSPPVPFYYPENAQERTDPEPLGNAQRESIRAVLASIENIADIDFVEVPFQPDGSNSIALFGLHNGFTGDVAATGGFPIDGLGSIGLGSDANGAIGGDVWFSSQLFPSSATADDVGPGSNFVFTALHEIGHTLGFKHPFVPQNGNDAVLPVSTDFPFHTVMSNTFTNDPLAETFALYDIQEIQRLYRANEEFNTGNNHYFFRNNSLTTVYDGGGTDTFNLTVSNANENISLHEGSFSSVNGIERGAAIAFGTTIENARGGRGNDTILGNSVRNLLFGNEGNDVLEGDGGNDVLRGGAGRDTYVWRTGDGRDQINEQTLGGVDSLHIFDDTALNSLQNDLVFRRFGRDLRIDLRFDRDQAQGSVLIRDQQWGGSRIETLRLFNGAGEQIGEDIDLNSIFVQANTEATFFRLTNQETNRGFIAVPV